MKRNIASAQKRHSRNVGLPEADFPNGEIRPLLFQLFQSPFIKPGRDCVI
jgi:hypothetical protein